VTVAAARPRFPIVNAMSVDVEDYYHVSALADAAPRTRWNEMASRVVPNTERLLAMFAEFRVRATFFVLGWVAEREPGLVRRIAAAGHELASHGFSHQLVYEQSRPAFRDDVRRAKALIEDAGGQRVRGYRAPSFSITTASLWALDILQAEGYEYDASIFPIRHDRYGIPNAERRPHAIAAGDGRLVEVPGSTLRVAGINLPACGGGYFRLLPYWWTRLAITRLNRREGRAAVFYLHPWEVDPDQPRLATSWLSGVRHYRHLDRTEPRLRRLLREFSFDALDTLVARVAAPDASGAHVPLASPALPKACVDDPAGERQPC
jgi:polysaccharide deacetylase family protein (PEP-CTERM system associated)